jgi:hypothetical protein
LPVAPSAGSFAWQGVQDQFVGEDMMPCTARVTIAASDQAMCFVGANGDLYCAGQLYTTDFGTTFMDTGHPGVEQILMSATFNTANNNAICVVVTGHGGECWGSVNDHGQFGDGTMAGSATPVPWGMFPDLHRIATGTWDQICGITTGGAVYCAGLDFAATPVSEGGGHTSAYVDTFGMLHLDSPTVLRVTNSYAQCQISTDGYDCNGPAPFGTAGAVVDGTVGGANPMAGRACWLDNAGRVTCTPWSPGPPATPVEAPMFTAMPVLEIAGNAYTDSLCAVYNDGSISCVGTNDMGQLGTGDTTYVSSETIVAPPGTIDVTCQ